MDLGLTSWLFLERCGQYRSSVGEQFELTIFLVERAKAGRAEEDYRVLNALAAEVGQRLGIFGENADDAAVGTVEEGRILVRQWRFGQRTRRRRFRRKV